MRFFNANTARKGSPAAYADRLRQDPPGLLLMGTALLFTGIIFATAMFELSVPLVFGGYNIQLLEALQLGPLFWLLLVARKLVSSVVVRGMVIVLLANSIPLIYGISVYGLSSALRDFAGVFYMIMIVFGYAIGRLRILSGVNLLLAFTALGVIFIPAYFFNVGSSVLDYEVLKYNYRVPGMVCFLAAVLSVAGLGRLHGWQRVCVMIGGLLYGGFILQLRTRGAHVALLAGSMVIVIQAAVHFVNEPAFLGRIIGRILLGVTAAVLLSVFYSEALSSLFENARERTDIVFTSAYYTDVTIAFRLEAWRLAWEEFLGSPLFGVGFGKYMILDPWLRREFALYPSHMMHNGLLQILYSGGLAALAGFVYLWWAVRKALVRSRVLNAVIPLLSLLVALAVYAAFGAILFKAVEAIPLWLIVGLAIGEAEVFSAEHSDKGAVARAESAMISGLGGRRIHAQSH